ncbi:unnamed protein product, partial [Effrenium voratum]
MFFGFTFFARCLRELAFAEYKVELQSFQMLGVPSRSPWHRGPKPETACTQRARNWGAEAGARAEAEGGGRGQALGVAVQQMPRLQTLKLNRNQIGDLGAQALARGLEGTTALQLLWLSQNQIGDAGCE